VIHLAYKRKKQGGFMANQALTRATERMPTFFDDFFKPWNEWFGNEAGIWNRAMTVPPVNITENKNEYLVSLAVPGMKKNDFKIDVEGNMLIISSEKTETKEESDKKFTRKEYNYSSFSRSFTLPEEINREMIEARYEDGVLKLVLPRKEEARKPSAKQIAVK